MTHTQRHISGIRQTDRNIEHDLTASMIQYVNKINMKVNVHFMTCYRDYCKKGVIEELSIMSECVECCGGCCDGCECDCNDCFDGCCDNCCDDCCDDSHTSCTLPEFMCLGCAGCFDCFEGGCDGTWQHKQEQDERERQYMQDQLTTYSEINQASSPQIQSQPQNTEFVPPVSAQPPPSDQPPPYPGTQI